MAPRIPESLDQFLTRLRAAVNDGASEVRFGRHHATHAVCHEDDEWVIRRLVCSKEAADAYMAEHGIFMPEHAEMIAEPADEVLRAASMTELEQALRARSWPML